MKFLSLLYDIFDLLTLGHPERRLYATGAICASVLAGAGGSLFLAADAARIAAVGGVVCLAAAVGAVVALLLAIRA